MFKTTASEPGFSGTAFTLSAAASSSLGSSQAKGRSSALRHIIEERRCMLNGRLSLKMWGTEEQDALNASLSAEIRKLECELQQALVEEETTHVEEGESSSDDPARQRSIRINACRLDIAA